MTDTEKKFKGAFREDVLEYAVSQYGADPEYLWESLPRYAVLRRGDNKKWYAVIMDLAKNKLGLKGDERIDILDIKCDAELREILLCQEGFMPAYHLNRENWITALLDGSVDKELIFDLLSKSYEAAKGKRRKAVRYESEHWIVPANPKYFDIEKAFEQSRTILWKQSASIIAGDTVYLYLATPYSCIRYCCKVLEVDIPYDYDDGNLHMSKVMKLELVHTYDADKFPLDRLKEHGIFSVRGARRIPYGLRYKLETERGDI